MSTPVFVNITGQRPTSDVVGFSGEIKLINYALNQNLIVSVNATINSSTYWVTSGGGSSGFFGIGRRSASSYGDAFKQSVFIELLNNGNLLHNYGDINGSFINSGFSYKDDPRQRAIIQLPSITHTIPPGITSILRLRMTLKVLRSDQWGYQSTDIFFQNFSATFISL